jgi:hypothetical protein
MRPLRDVLPGVLNSIIRRAPRSAEKAAFAWTVAVGPAISRASQVSLGESGTLIVRFDDRHWKKEVERSLQVVTARLNDLLGPGTVTRITLIGPAGRPSKAESNPVDRG